MALIDIDVHVLSQLAAIRREKKDISKKARELLFRYSELESEEWALLQRLVNEVRLVRTRDKNEARVIDNTGG